MIRCPLCQLQRSDMLPQGVYLSTLALRILQKLNPTWAESDGLCQRCYEAAMDTACELEDMDVDHGTKGFLQYLRYHLSSREIRLWNHANPDLAHWHRMNIDEKVALEAIGAGYDAWLVFGADEELLAQGCSTEKREGVD